MASNKMLIDASHPEETRVVVLRGNRIEEYDFESQNKRQLKGNIYLAKVTRVEPSLQAAFVDYGGNRHGFLAFNEIHPDYYQIPVADRQALLDEEAAEARRDNAEEDLEPEITRKSDETDAGDTDIREENTPEESVSEEEPQEEKSNRRKRRPRRKSAAIKSSDEPVEALEETNPDEDATGEDTPPASMAAMMEMDSISEPAPDEDPTEDDSDAPASSEDGAAKPEKRRSNRRPRKKPAAKAEAATKAESESVQEEPKEVAEADAQTAAAPEVSEDDDRSSEEKPKPKARRRRKPSRSRAKKDAPENDTAAADDDNNNNGVETAGQNEASEELPPRRRARRQYKIQEVIKRRQVLLVQVVKEERGNKGAALTTYLSLAGRYSVLMPNTARGGGISRKITNAPDRKRLKAIATGLEVPEGMGVILRTAGASRDGEEIQRDFEYLMRLWEQVRALTLSSSAPCLVYEEGSLIKRSIRDLYDKNTGEVQVAGESGFKEARDFMEMLMPSHTSSVKLYQDEQAMFSRFGVEQQLDKMLSQQVTLKSGGYLVIDQTEALVAIDVNSGRATREHSIEETALQTNLETAEEVARQLRLRDLAGLIVIDFIDMEENRNNRAVEKKLKECLKHDRARIQVGRISHFGLMEMSRQRMRASVLDSTMDVCAHCQGKGHIRSNPSVGLHILRSIEEHLLKNSKFDIIVKAANEIALYMLNHKRQALMEIEARFGLKIFVEGSRDLLGENFTIDKGEPSFGERVPISHIQAGQISDTENAIETKSDNPKSGNNGDDDQGDGDNKPPKRKRRRKRGRGNDEETTQEADASQTVVSPATDTSRDDEEPAKPKRSRGKRGGRNSRKSDTQKQTDEVQTVDVAVAEQSADAPQAEEEPAPRSRNSRPRKAKPKAADTDTTAEPDAAAAPTVPNDDVREDDASPAPEPAKPKRRATKRRPAKSGKADDDTIAAPEAVAAKAGKQDANVPSEPASETDAPEKEEKKGGWWSRSGFFN